MSVESPEDLAGLRRAGLVVARALEAMKAAVREGVTTAELDRVAREVIDGNGARSAPQLAYDFPGTTCISVNEEAVHGIPGPRRLEAGDLVTLDVTVELGGYYADAAVTVGVPPVAAEAQRLLDCARAAWEAGARVARAGVPMAELGGAVEAEVERRGFRVLRDLCGHGIGRAIHEGPDVLNYRERRATRRLARGLVIALEPIIAASSRHSRPGGDGWTLTSADGSLTAHHEHTLVITDAHPIVITALEDDEDDEGGLGG